MTDGEHAALQEALLELGRIVLSEDSLERVLLTVAESAKALLADAIEVSVTLLRGDHFETVASTGRLATEVDERQYEIGRGPCLHAAMSGETVIVPDMRSETRWPTLAALALAAGAGSSLSIPLPAGEQVVGALNVYSAGAGAFDDTEIDLAQVFSNHAAVAVHSASLHARTAHLAARLEAAMTTRAVIEQAKGIIMARAVVTADEAFDRLRLASQRLNIKLRDIAQHVVDTGQLPDELG